MAGDPRQEPSNRSSHDDPYHHTRTPSEPGSAETEPGAAHKFLLVRVASTALTRSCAAAGVPSGTLPSPRTPTATCSPTRLSWTTPGGSMPAEVEPAQVARPRGGAG